VNFLGTPDRVDWKVCQLSEEEDKADATAFKAAFAPFDPSSREDMYVEGRREACA